MKVYAYMGDAWACGHYRIAWPGRAVDDPEIEVEVVEPGAREVRMQVDQTTGRVISEGFPADADVVVLQRPTLEPLIQVIPLLRRRGVAVVVDMDDDLTSIDPRNPAHRGFRPTVWHPGSRKFVPNLNSYHNATEVCRAATLVTATTPALLRRYAAHGRGRVLPNYIPEDYLRIPHEDSPTIGWGGQTNSHPDDLQRVGPAIVRLVRAGATFETVGDKVGVARALGLSADPGGPGSCALLDWAPNLARFGIGIAPLADTRFNASKSRLKPLEYAAVGVPSVASPTPDYTAFAEEGGCLVAEKPRVWEGTLRRLVADEPLRRELSSRVRDVAAANTVEAHAWRWAEAWSDAVEIERAAAPARV